MLLLTVIIDTGFLYQDVVDIVHSEKIIHLLVICSPEKEAQPRKIGASFFPLAALQTTLLCP